MRVLRNLLSKKPATPYAIPDFWNWFQSEAKHFHAVVKKGSAIEGEFLKKVSFQLQRLETGIYLLTGMANEETAELIFTADGEIRQFYWVEALVAAAPALQGWRFTAHKPAHAIDMLRIQMGNFQFDSENIRFAPLINQRFPDEIAIAVTHHELTKANKDSIATGLYIFLDNLLGEVRLATAVDHIEIGADHVREADWVPIGKLSDYLNWREQEFVEKYDGARHLTANDNYATFEGRMPDGQPIIGTMNTDVLHWDRHCSHPWLLKITIEYDGAARNGMPDNDTYARMNELEDALNEVLTDKDGYLNIGRQTGANTREVYFACHEFRESSRVTRQIIQRFQTDLHIEYAIYKDKYWKTFDRFKG